MSTNGLYLIKDKLTHGYLLFGPKNGQKLVAARCLVNYLENKKWEEPRSVLLDSLLIEDDPGIDIIRNIQQFLWQKPVKSSRRAVIISRAQKLTPQAQNAILKIAEEPPPMGLLILIAEQPEALLGTVISRFQKIFFPNQEPRIVNQGIKLEEALTDDNLLEEYVAAKMTELARDPTKNYQALKALLKRWTYINQFNVNKKLQLEAFLYWTADI